MTPETRSANPNPSVDEYKAEIDLHKRKFAVQKAVEAQAAGMNVDLLEMSASILRFLETGEVPSKE